jgi:hypothetical protein
MPETMVKRDEMVPVDYFTPFTPPRRRPHLASPLLGERDDDIRSN